MARRSPPLPTTLVLAGQGVERTRQRPTSPIGDGASSG
jgi:hypothetical protein